MNLNFSAKYKQDQSETDHGFQMQATKTVFCPLLFSLHTRVKKHHRRIIRMRRLKSTHEQTYNV